MDREQIDALVNQYLTAQIREIEVRLSVNLPASNEAGRDVYRDGLYEELEQLEYRLKEGDYRDAHSMAESLFRGASEEARAVLARRLLEAKHEALCAEIEGAEGLPWRRLLNVQTSPNVPVKEPPKKATPLLSEQIKNFCEAKVKAKKWTVKTAVLNKGRLQTDLELLGDKPIGAYSPEEMEKLQGELPLVPANFRSWKEFQENKSFTAKDAITFANQSAEEIERLGSASVNLHVDILKSVFIAAAKKRVIDRSPMDGLESVEEDDIQRKPFTDDDLELIFANLKEDSEEIPSRWWIPHLLLFSGARLNEMAQLHKEDIQQHHGVWMFDMNEEGVKKIKTGAKGRRFVPIHSRLIEMGFIDYAERIAEGHLFPELPFKDGAGFSSELSKWAGRRLRRLGIADPLKVANHSFRHTMATRLGNAGVEGQTTDQLLGWKSAKNMRARYVHPFEAKTKQEAIEKFMIPKGVLRE